MANLGLTPPSVYLPICATDARCCICMTSIAECDSAIFCPHCRQFSMCPSCFGYYLFTLYPDSDPPDKQVFCPLCRGKNVLVAPSLLLPINIPVTSQMVAERLRLIANASIETLRSEASAETFILDYLTQNELLAPDVMIQLLSCTRTTGLVCGIIIFMAQSNQLRLADIQQLPIGQHPDNFKRALNSVSNGQCTIEELFDQYFFSIPPSLLQLIVQSPHYHANIDSLSGNRLAYTLTLLPRIPATHSLDFYWRKMFTNIDLKDFDIRFINKIFCIPLPAEERNRIFILSTLLGGCCFNKKRTEINARFISLVERLLSLTSFPFNQPDPEAGCSEHSCVIIWRYFARNMARYHERLSERQFCRVSALGIKKGRLVSSANVLKHSMQEAITSQDLLQILEYLSRAFDTDSPIPLFSEMFSMMREASIRFDDCILRYPRNSIFLFKLSSLSDTDFSFFCREFFSFMSADMFLAWTSTFISSIRSVLTLEIKTSSDWKSISTFMKIYHFALQMVHNATCLDESEFSENDTRVADETIASLFLQLLMEMKSSDFNPIPILLKSFTECHLLPIKIGAAPDTFFTRDMVQIIHVSKSSKPVELSVSHYQRFAEIEGFRSELEPKLFQYYKEQLPEVLGRSFPETLPFSTFSQLTKPFFTLDEQCSLILQRSFTLAIDDQESWISFASFHCGKLYAVGLIDADILPIVMAKSHPMAIALMIPLLLADGWDFDSVLTPDRLGAMLLTFPSQTLSGLLTQVQDNCTRDTYMRKLESGTTLLHITARRDLLDWTKFLINSGVDYTAVDSTGSAIIDVATGDSAIYIRDLLSTIVSEQEQEQSGPHLFIPEWHHLPETYISPALQPQSGLDESLSELDENDFDRILDLAGDYPY